MNNLIAITSNIGLQPEIINGRQLKSYNNHFNKQLAKAKSNLPFMDKSKAESFYINKKTGKQVHRQHNTSKRTDKLYLDRQNYINTYMHTVSKYIIDYCITNDIGNIVLGYNKEWKQEIDLGKKTNQNFSYIPYKMLVDQILYKADLLGIKVILKEEWFTSKCSALDLEPICYHKKYIGERKHRGLFKYLNGYSNG